MKQTLNNLWPNSTVFVIGGGPSLKGVDLTLIHNQYVIGVNNSYLLGDWVDICFFGDLKWWRWHNENLKFNFKGKVAHCNESTYLKNRDWIYGYARGNPKGIETRENYVSWNRCSGFAAINLAYHMGARKIVLIGFDMQVVGGKKNWHNDHQENMSMQTAKERYQHYLVCPKFIQRDATKLDVQIINTCMDSVIVEFEKIPLEQVIKEC